MVQKIVSTGLLIHKNKLLIIQRALDEVFLPGYYELPGGKVDFGEDPKEALAREYHEEVNLHVQIGKPFHVFSYLSENGNRHTVEILFHVTLLGNDSIELSSAHDDYQWITPKEVDQYLMTSEIQKAIQLGFRNIRS